MKYADLHVHTFYSDSTFSPEEVIAYAEKKGLGAVAICDHDSIDGIEPCMEAGRAPGIEVVPGVELTVEKKDAEIHILGYFLDYTLESLKERLKKMRDFRRERVYKMVEKLRSANVMISADDVFRVSGKGSVGRPHVAKAMLDKGGIRTFKEAFDKYIGFLKPCYIPNIKFSPQEAMSLVKDAGGVPVLAHPAAMGKDEYIPELVKHGLRGIEVYRTDHSRSAVEHYEKIAREYGLLVTGGSDCHGLSKSKVLLGEVRVPYDLVEALRDESAKIRKERNR